MIAMAPIPVNPPLAIAALWHDGGHRCVRWAPASRQRVTAALPALRDRLAPVLSRRCTHVRGLGGLKAAVREARSLAARRPFVARFDIRSYYESIDHGLLLGQLREAGVTGPLSGLLGQYLALPDRRGSGRGLVAGAALSPLLAALYLTPLDRAMERLAARGLGYLRFMDDFVLFAPTRHILRAAIRAMHAVLATLRLDVHPGKRFIGKTERGFDFLGYRIRPAGKLRPAAQSVQRLCERARRLHERGAGESRIRRYVQRWYAWLHGGLGGRVAAKGGVTGIWVIVLKRLHITGYRVHPA